MTYSRNEMNSPKCFHFLTSRRAIRNIATNQISAATAANISELEAGTGVCNQIYDTWLHLDSLSRCTFKTAYGIFRVVIFASTTILRLSLSRGFESARFQLVTGACSIDGFPVE